MVFELASAHIAFAALQAACEYFIASSADFASLAFLINSSTCFSIGF